MEHSSEYPGTLPTAQQAKRQVESLLDELAELAETEVPEGEFFAQTLDRVVFACSGQGAIAWKLLPGGALQPTYRSSLRNAYPSESGGNFSPEVAAKIVRDQQLLADSLKAKKPQVIVPNGSDELLICHPLEVAGKKWGELVLYHQADLPQSTRTAYARVLEAFAEVVSHYQRNDLLRSFDQRQREWQTQWQFAKWAHRDLDFHKTCYHLANEARGCLDVDRVTVASVTGSRVRVESISGIEEPHRRSNAVRNLQRLVEVVVRGGQPLVYDGASDDLAPQIEQRLEAYLDESPARVLAIFPLETATEEHGEGEAANRPSQRGEVIGALVVENLEQQETRALLRRCEPVVEHAALALENATRFRRIPLRGPLQVLGTGLSWLGWYRLPTTLKVAVPLLLLVVALFLIPTDFEIEVRGELQPLERRNIYAPADGHVRRIAAEHGLEVAPGQVLLELESSEFTLRRTELTGLITTTQAELDSVWVRRTQGARRDSRSPERDTPESLSADEVRLTKRLENLREQLELLNARDAELRVTSPIAGQVMDWELEGNLASRPVGRGELLLKVADTAGPWQLEFQLPDRRTYHVLAAMRQADEPLPIRFQLVNEPGRHYPAKLRDVATMLDLDQDQEEPFVTLTADFDRSEIDHLRPGLTVLGRVYCGRRSIAYVWTHELIETVRRRLFW
ncbi:MAG: efflux RND transporter periplasmic adaptor subunit [Pirellulaceae bacterium]